MTPARRRFNRDVAIAVVGLGLFIYEVVWGGGRPTVLPWIVGLLASPVASRIDELIRKDKKRTDLDEPDQAD